MPRKFIAISVYLENDVASDPDGYCPEITYFDHRDSVQLIQQFFPGLNKEDLPDCEGWAIEKAELLTHNGTHLDAPYHFHSTMDKGHKSVSIDEVPLDWCFRKGVKLDFRSLEDGYVVNAKDVEEELHRIDYELNTLDIVLVNTRAGNLYGFDDYV